jgi:hypothetical protein
MSSDVEHFKKLEAVRWLPDDVKISINTFIKSAIIVEENNLDSIPSEYVINLLESVKKHKELGTLYLELVEILLPELTNASME